MDWLLDLDALHIINVVNFRNLLRRESTIYDWLLVKIGNVNLSFALGLELLNRVMQIHVLVLVCCNELLHRQVKVVLEQMVLVNELWMILRVA